MAKRKYLFDGVHDGHYVRAWRGRRGWAIDVWWQMQSPDGEPQGSWEMPGVLSLEAAIAQSILQTKP